MGMGMDVGIKRIEAWCGVAVCMELCLHGYEGRNHEWRDEHAGV